MHKHKVDGDLKKIQGFMAGARRQSKALATLGLSVVFLIAVLLYASFAQGESGTGVFVIAAAVMGAYLVMNMGASDVANTIGPAVGSHTLTVIGALCIAVLFEAAGAIVAGGDVVTTIGQGLVDPAGMADPIVFILVMMSALLAAALWINVAIWIGAPVATTHSIVGGVVGAAIAAAGASSVDWGNLGMLAASWVVSPILGGVIAAAFLYFINRMIFWQDDKLEASRTWIPVFLGIMVGAFSMYLVMKGLTKVWNPDAGMLWLIAVGGFAITWAVSKSLVAKASIGLENRKRSVAKLFTFPLIGSAALLSFAHGANDVANVVGPLAAIVSVAADANTGVGDGKVALPLWVMAIGAVGISIGMLLFGPKLIRTVGEKITQLNQMRAFCVALAAAITVITASWFGLPVSSTHIAVGGILGVGFLREYQENEAVKEAHQPAETLKELKKLEKRRLLRRREMLTVVASWVITLPVAGLLSASLFFVLYNGFR